MAELKTKRNDSSVEAFLDGIPDERKRRDSRAILELMKRVTGLEPEMWGDGIVGFGSYHYRYKSGREGDWLVTGFSPRKQSLTVYIMPGFDRFQELLGRLGEHKTSVSCLYINKLEDVDTHVLEELIERSLKVMDELYGWRRPPG